MAAVSVSPADVSVQTMTPIQRAVDPKITSHYRSGMAVIGRDGRLGKLTGVREDPATGEPAYLLVKRPGIFGLGTTRLVPASWATRVHDGRVWIDADDEMFAQCPVLRSDVDLTVDVSEALYRATILAPSRSGMRVTVNDGIVELTGHVRTPMHREVAEECVRSVPGVLDVRNQLVDDMTLATRVAQPLTLDETIREAHLRFNSNLGVIELLGELPSEEAQRRAIDLARSVRGVVDVHTGITIQNTTSADEEPDMPLPAPISIETRRRPAAMVPERAAA